MQMSLCRCQSIFFSAKLIIDSATKILLSTPGHQLTLANIEALQRQDHLVYQNHLHICVCKLRVLGLHFLHSSRGISHGELSNVFIPNPAITVWQLRSGHGECTAWIIRRVEGLCENSRLIAKMQGIGKACLPVLCTRSGKLHAFWLQKFWMAGRFHWEVLRKAFHHSNVFLSPALTMAGDFQRSLGSRHWVPIRGLNLICSAGVAFPQQAAAARCQLAWAGRAPSVSVAPCCLPNTEVEMLASPWSLRLVPITEDHPWETPQCFSISFFFGHRKVFWS